MSVPGSTSGGASFECSLAGTVHPGQFRHLYDRLLGLCEHSAHSKMFEHELLFTPAVQRPIYAARNDEVQLRLCVKLTVLDQSNKQAAQLGVQDGISSSKRKKMENESTQEKDISKTSTETTGPDTVMGTQEPESGTQQTMESVPGSQAAPPSVEMQSQAVSSQQDLEQQQLSYHHGSKTIVTRQYQLCQYGYPEPGRNVVVRSAILVKIHGDAFGFLSLLGYGFEDEYVRRGYNFMYNNICKISVYRKYKLSKQHDPFSAIVPEEEAASGISAETSSPWLVEIASSFVSQENVNTMSDEINAVRNLLAGSVIF
ncbi:hypothetical protein BG011_003788 [Mortierella polycephala]|uniref:Mediator of RNA polymerase II transcription subunit 18 n=1 Tax=Mortierella polycephala TaxID=41804 RepID=A0A9P6Q019_9FUNG|nr:hypothetical protein BG011_003788 [Mortierella polycephala]